MKWLKNAHYIPHWKVGTVLNYIWEILMSKKLEALLLHSLKFTEKTFSRQQFNC